VTPLLLLSVSGGVATCCTPVVLSVIVLLLRWKVDPTGGQRSSDRDMQGPRLNSQEIKSDGSFFFIARVPRAESADCKSGIEGSGPHCYQVTAFRPDALIVILREAGHSIRRRGDRGVKSSQLQTPCGRRRSQQLTEGIRRPYR
jgi:hypothetical protein